LKCGKKKGNFAATQETLDWRSRQKTSDVSL
jgi:hypothetical protein